MKQRKLLSQRHPFFYFLSINEKRLRRKASYVFDHKKYSSTTINQDLQYRVKKHQSRLLRKLGDTDMQLQHNKVDNLRIAIQNLNNIIIRPGETLSFCKLVGRPTKRKGYKLGVELSFGKARPGIGGGICQIANMLHWLSLHSPLTITERHHHHVDPFPDDGRVLPWATGAAVFFNYRDFQVTNNTEHTFQIKLWLTDSLLMGELRVDKELPLSYHVLEKNHTFVKEGEDYFRKNEIWREMVDKRTGNKLPELELIAKNHGRVLYVPEEGKIHEL